MILSSQARLYRKDGPALGMAGHMTRQRAAVQRVCAEIGKKEYAARRAERSADVPRALDVCNLSRRAAIVEQTQESGCNRG